MAKPPPFITFSAFTHSGTNGLLNLLITPIEVSPPVPSGAPPASNRWPAKGLWDTGCTGAAISSSLVQRMGLIPSGVTRNHHAGGVDDNARTYIVDLYLPNNVRVTDVPVVEVVSMGDWDVLIGMSVINLGDFSITNVGGKTVFSFRFPSIKTIDYVIEANSLNPAQKHNAQCCVGISQYSENRGWY